MKILTGSQGKELDVFSFSTSVSEVGVAATLQPLDPAKAQANCKRCLRTRELEQAEQAICGFSVLLLDRLHVKAGVTNNSVVGELLRKRPFLIL